MDFKYFTEFWNGSLNFILKLSTLILTTKLQSSFFVVTETLDSDNVVRIKSVLLRVTISSSPLFPP